MIDYYEPKFDLTLMGCGFLGTYHLGAIRLLEQIWPQKPYNRICGASCGGLVGALLISGLKLDYVLEVAVAILRLLRAHLRRLRSPNNWNNGSVTSAWGAKRDNSLNEQSFVASAAIEASSFLTRQFKRPKSAHRMQLKFTSKRRKFRAQNFPLPPVGQLVEQMLDSMLPDDAHLKCTHQLGLSVTRASWQLENEFVSEFRSRDDLIQAVCAGCFIPLWSGSLHAPKFRDAHYLDGAYSDNRPMFEPDKNANDVDVLQLSHGSVSELQTSSAGSQTGNTNFVLGKTIRQVCLSPFCCQVDISPSDEDTFKLFSGNALGTTYVCNWRNIVRCLHAMLPSRLDTYKAYLISGHREMKDYLFRNGMLMCRKCYNDAMIQIGNKKAHCNAKNLRKSDCLYCLKLFEQVDSLKLSERVLSLLNE